MRTFFTLIIAMATVAGAYFYTFGVPASLAAMTGLAPETAAPVGATPAGARTGRPAGGRGGGRSTTVVLTPLETQPYEDILRAVGSAKALRSANVIANVSGEVIGSHLSANQYVAAGDVLVELDDRSQVLGLEIAETNLAQATETVQRYERLRTTGNSTVSDVTLSEARVAQRLAEANVGLAKVALDNRTIRAPIAGRLGLSDVEIGDTLSSGADIVTIDDSQALLVEFELPERSIGLLAREQVVLVSTPTFAGRVFEGRITSFDSRIDSVTRSVTVQARIENPDRLLWPGMTFSVRIEHQSDPLAVLPSTAITWSRTGSNVWIDKDGKAETVPVTILFRRDSMVWIEADIADGTMVVTEGAQKLRAGAAITDANAPPRERPGPDATGPGTPERRNPDAGPRTRPDADAPEIGQADSEKPKATEEPT